MLVGRVQLQYLHLRKGLHVPMLQHVQHVHLRRRAVPPIGIGFGRHRMHFVPGGKVHTTCALNRSTTAPTQRARSPRAPRYGFSLHAAEKSRATSVACHFAPATHMPLTGLLPTIIEQRYYCPAQSASYKDCPAGYYCPAGSASAKACPGGQYMPYSKYATVSTDCFSCPGVRPHAHDLDRLRVSCASLLCILSLFCV